MVRVECDSRSAWLGSWGFGLLGFVATLACSATRIGGKEQQHPVLVSAPMTVGDGDTGKPQRRTKTSQHAAPARTPPHELPDPQPTQSARQWQYRLRFHDGDIEVAEVTERVFSRPVVTARHMGRFAIELWIGRELIDRVRFDFPLLGAETPPGESRSIGEQPRFEPGLEAARTVLVPHSERATRAQLVDRATGRIRALPWPPDAPLDPRSESFPGAASEAESQPIPE